MRVDFHTHSVASPDGSLTLTQYRRMLESGRLDYAAITDHDTIGWAVSAQAELGARIIVGEEVACREGELIGLFLTAAVPPGLTALATARAIHAQGGLVYVPHPFERVRKGLSASALNAIAAEVDVVETHNGRAVFGDQSRRAAEWAHEHAKAHATGSDAHGWHGWGQAFTEVAAAPTRANLVNLLAAAQHERGKVGVRGMLYPKFNRLRHRST